jgi:hypothetical protein
MTHRLLALATGALAAAAMAGCGSAAHDAAPPAADANAGAAVHGPARYLDRHALALALGNGFRTRLDQLAVMQQPADGATDLGQSLPAGLVRDVRCASDAARPAGAAPWPWRCRVRWETVAGRTKTTNYTVRSFPTGCFAAGAVPRMAAVKDPTIASYSEHPLNAVASQRKGC